MTTRTPALLALAAVLALGATACSEKREVKASTGTATVEVKTTAPENAVSDSQLQAQAQQAATAASTPVNGMSGANTTGATTSTTTTTSNTAH